MQDRSIARCGSTSLTILFYPLHEKGLLQRIPMDSIPVKQTGHSLNQITISETPTIQSKFQPLLRFKASPYAAKTRKKGQTLYTSNSLTYERYPTKEKHKTHVWKYEDIQKQRLE
eukprot:TRINITY_DN15530_c0_g2_i2.p1 TRINITY_DN15530_c0_g2~~TRINITY_DN15530_c0_g2_i2.p1  ORF type:complete len:115 (-),score=8.99 TRINITY_DN15530_c0_g2_i2:195-539(-)